MGGLEREAAASAGDDVEGERGVLSELELIAAHEEGDARDCAEKYVAGADLEVAERQHIGELPSQQPPD